MKHNILQGPNLRLRMLEPSDVEILYQWENDESVWRVSSTLVPFSRFQLEQYILNSQHDIFTEKQLRLMIDLCQPDMPKKVIGCVDLFDFDPINMRTGVGILIIASERKKGFASEALRVIIRYAFEILQLHQIWCNITSDNEISLHLFQKAGFTGCGIKKHWRRTGETWVDEVMLQLIRK
jgi:diamine N-acetyltransferase